MQTFLPYTDFTNSAKTLDYRRLGKQRGECKQILRALGVPVGPDPLTVSGWRNHPAVRMWRDHEQCLIYYAQAICLEWIRRGYNDSLLPEFAAVRDPEIWSVPPWLGDEAFHRSHRSNLIRKKPDHYRPMWPDVPDDLPYVWPV